MKDSNTIMFFFIACSLFIVSVAGNNATECRTAPGGEEQTALGDDIASRLWSQNLSNQANVKRFKAIRSGLLQNMNATIHELYDAVESSDMKEVQFQLKQINEKWKDIHDLHRAILQFIPEEDTTALQEETKLFADNRDVLRRLNDQAEEFIAGRFRNTASKTSESKSIRNLTPLSKVNGDAPVRQIIVSTVIPPLPPVSAVVKNSFRSVPTVATTRVTTTRTPPTTTTATTTTTRSTTTTTTSAPLTQLDRLKNKREKLVEQMRNVIKTIEPVVETPNGKAREEVKNLFSLIDDKLWPEIIKLSAKIYAEEDSTSNRRWRESLYQQDLKNTLARIHYKAGLRKCISSEETYYLGRCQRLGNPGLPCAENMQLYDGKDNNGFCHCKYQDATQPHNGLIYVDGNCYVQNVQGPCTVGQWLTVNEDGDPVCTPVPIGCGPPSKDGRKVFWNPEPNKKLGSCVQLGSKQQCGVLYRQGFQLLCGNHPNATVEPSVTNDLPPLAGQRCPKGYFVDQFNKCIRGIQL